MEIRNLLISLGVTSLTSILLFMYFRNRIGEMENKVDVIFQLIQQHAANSAPRFPENVAFPDRTMEENKDAEYSRNLVEVSDDESDDEGDDDSEEVSDDEEQEEEKALKIESTPLSLFDTDNTVKKINLSIDGSETKSSDAILNNLEELNISSDILNNEKINVHPEDYQEEPPIVVQKLESPEKGSLSDIELEESDNETADEEIAKKVEEIKPVLSLDAELLRKKTVAQLKVIAAQRNLSRYKSLTKKRLIARILEQSII